MTVDSGANAGQLNFIESFLDIQEVERTCSTNRLSRRTVKYISMVNCLLLSLKKVIAFGGVIVLIAALSVYGMNLLATTGSASMTSVVTSSPLQLKLELQKNEFEQGEPINITVSLKNIGDTRTTVRFTSTGSYVRFRVFDASDKRVYEEGWAVWQGVDELSLAPSEQVSRTFTWHQNIWNIVGDTVVDEYQAPKGTYKIVGMPGATIGVVGIGDIELTTSPVTITIT